MFQQYQSPHVFDGNVPYSPDLISGDTLMTYSSATPAGAASYFRFVLPTADQVLFEFHGLNFAPKRSVFSVVFSAVNPSSIAYVSGSVQFFDVDSNLIAAIPFVQYSVGSAGIVCTIPDDAHRAVPYMSSTEACSIYGSARVGSYESIPYQPLKG